MAGDQKVMTPLRERTANSFINPVPMSGVKPFASAERFRPAIGSFASSPIPMSFPRSPKTDAPTEVEEKRADAAKASTVDNSSAGTVKELRARFQQAAAPAYSSPAAHSTAATGIVRKLPLTAFPYRAEGPASPTPSTSPTRSLPRSPRSPPSVAESYHAYMCRMSPQPHGHSHGHAESPAAQVSATMASPLNASSPAPASQSGAMAPEERSSSAASERAPAAPHEETYGEAPSAPEAAMAVATTPVLQAAGDDTAPTSPSAAQPGNSANHPDACPGATDAAEVPCTAEEEVAELAVEPRGQEGEGNQADVLSVGKQQQADVSFFAAVTEDLELELVAGADLGETGLEMEGVMAVLALGAPSLAEDAAMEGFAAHGVTEASQLQVVLRGSPASTVSPMMQEVSEQQVVDKAGHNLEDHPCNEEGPACIDMDIGNSPEEQVAMGDVAAARDLSPGHPISVFPDTSAPEAQPTASEQPAVDTVHDAASNSLAPAEVVAHEGDKLGELEAQAPIVSSEEGEGEVQRHETDWEESQQGPEMQPSSSQTEAAPLPVQEASGLSPRPIGALPVAHLPSVTPPSPLPPPPATPTSATPPSGGSAGSRAFYQQQQSAEGRVLAMTWDPTPASPAPAAASSAAGAAAVATVAGQEGTARKAQADPMAAWWRISGTEEGAVDTNGAGAILDGLMDEAVRQLIASPVAQSHTEPFATVGATSSNQGVPPSGEAAAGPGAEASAHSECKTEATLAEEAGAEAEGEAGEVSAGEGGRGSFSLDEEAATPAGHALATDSHLEEDESTSLRHKIGGLADGERRQLRSQLARERGARQELQEELRRGEERRRELEEQVGEMQAALRKEVDMRAKTEAFWRDQIDKCNARIDELKARASRKDEECRRQQQEVEKRGTLVKIHVRKAAALEATVEATRKSLNAAELELREHKASLNALREKQQEASQRCQQLSGLLQGVKGQHKELEEAMASQVQTWEERSRKIAAVVTRMGKESDKWKGLYLRECKQRKLAHSKMMELRGNIRVFSRTRPLLDKDRAAGAKVAVEFDPLNPGALLARGTNGKPREFEFDRAFDPTASQENVFAEASDVVVSVMDGFDVCIFAYGQTGTGKTHTMEGDETRPGMNFRTLEKLFHIKGERKEQSSYSIHMSVMEVYNETIRDLLAGPPPEDPKDAKKLEVKQQADGRHYVPGLVEEEVTSAAEAWDVLRKGSGTRAVHSTKCNNQSSRSHCLVCVTVRCTSVAGGAGQGAAGSSTLSRLWLVDLAGSERVAKSEVTGERLSETKSINSSLLHLGDVIFALANKASFVNFRSSKLTMLLQDSLGGQAKVVMLVHVSPSDKDASETMASLNFASKARGVELGPAKRQADTMALKGMADRQREQAEQAEARARQQREELEQALAAATWRAEQAELKEHRALQRMQELEAFLASSAAPVAASHSALGSHATSAILGPAPTGLLNAAEQPQQENGAAAVAPSGVGAGASKPAFNLRPVKDRSSPATSPVQLQARSLSARNLSGSNPAKASRSAAAGAPAGHSTGPLKPQTQVQNQNQAQQAQAQLPKKSPLAKQSLASRFGVPPGAGGASGIPNAGPKKGGAREGQNGAGAGGPLGRSNSGIPMPGQAKVGSPASKGVAKGPDEGAKKAEGGRKEKQAVPQAEEQGGETRGQEQDKGAVGPSSEAEAPSKGTGPSEKGQAKAGATGTRLPPPGAAQGGQKTGQEGAKPPAGPTARAKLASGEGAFVWQAEGNIARGGQFMFRGTPGPMAPGSSTPGRPAHRRDVDGGLRAEGGARRRRSDIGLPSSRPPWRGLMEDAVAEPGGLAGPGNGWQGNSGLVPAGGVPTSALNARLAASGAAGAALLLPPMSGCKQQRSQSMNMDWYESWCGSKRQRRTDGDQRYHPRLGLAGTFEGFSSFGLRVERMETVPEFHPGCTDPAAPPGSAIRRGPAPRPPLGMSKPPLPRPAQGAGAPKGRPLPPPRSTSTGPAFSAAFRPSASPAGPITRDDSSLSLVRCNSGSSGLEAFPSAAAAAVARRARRQSVASSKPSSSWM